MRGMLCINPISRLLLLFLFFEPKTARKAERIRSYTEKMSDSEKNNTLHSTFCRRMLYIESGQRDSKKHAVRIGCIG